MANYLVTGANRGLGLEFVRQLSARGDTVIACCREPAKASELQAIGGERLSILALDVSDPKAIATLPGQLAKDGLFVDVLINNAGVAEADEAFGEFDATTMANVLRINAIAPMLVTQAMVPLLEKSAGKAKVVYITSGLGSIERAEGLVYGLSYGMSKAALNMGGKKLAAELTGRGIASVLLHPGWVQTDMGGAGAPLQAVDSIRGMLKVIDKLSVADGLRYVTYEGGTLPW